MHIRKLLKEDVEAYRDLRLRALKHHPEAFGSSYEENREQNIDYFRNHIPEPDGENAIFVAEIDGQLVGMAGFMRHTRQKMRHKSEIWGVYVDAEMRGQGIGRALIAAILAYARQIRGLQQVSLNVVATNAIAIALYESFGFVVWGTEPDALYVNETYYDRLYLALAL